MADIDFILFMLVYACDTLSLSSLIPNFFHILSTISGLFLLSLRKDKQC